jgi:hypothetical protein
VRLFHAGSLDDQLTTINWIRGATLTIKDDQSNIYPLKEATAGNYQTAASFKGTPGMTYTLQIVISENERYESLPQTMLPVGEIDTLYYEFVKPEDPQSSMQNPATENGFNFYVDTPVLPEQNKLVRWRTVGTFQINTLPWLQTTTQTDPRTGLISIVPDPPECSGYKYFPVSHNPDGTVRPINLLTKLGVCTCCTCWPSVYESRPLLSEPKFLNDNYLSRVWVGFIQADRNIFSQKFYFQVDQMSVTQEAYNFWQTIKKQEGTGNDLFQTPAARTTGNITPVGDTQTPVMGLFAVSSISSRSVFIDKTEIPYNMLPMDSIRESCLDAYKKNNTTTKPVYWQ